MEYINLNILTKPKTDELKLREKILDELNKNNTEYEKLKQRVRLKEGIKMSSHYDWTAKGN